MRVMHSLLVLAGVFVLSAGRLWAQEPSSVQEAHSLLIEASGLVKQIPESQQSSAAANIAGRLADAGDLQAAIATARLVPRDRGGDLSLGVVAWVLARNGNLSEALALADSMDERTKEQNYQDFASILAEKGELPAALHIVRSCRDPARRAQALLSIVRERAKSKKDAVETTAMLDEAIRNTDEALTQGRFNLGLLAEVAKVQNEIGERGNAEQSLERLSAIARDYPVSEDNSFPMYLVASTQAQLGDLVGARLTAAEIPAANFVDAALMIVSQEQANRGLTTDALENASLISDPGQKWAALREVAMTLGTHGTLQDALRAFDLMPDEGGRAEAVATLALEQAENTNPAAHSTLQAAYELAKDPSSPLASKALETVAVTHAELGDFAGAREILESMEQPESRVWPLWNITAMLAESGRHKEALAFAENETSPYPKAYALLGTAQGLLHRENAEKK